MISDFEKRLDALEAEAQPLPRCLLLKPDDEVPGNVTDFDSIISVTRAPAEKRDLSACDDVLEITIRQPRRALTITHGSRDRIPRVSCVEPGFSD